MALPDIDEDPDGFAICMVRHNLKLSHNGYKTANTGNKWISSFAILEYLVNSNNYHKYMISFLAFISTRLVII